MKLRLSPGQFAIGLLIIECLLWLIQSWFAKGWAVLIAVSSAGVAVILVPLWIAASLFLRRPFQFSVRTLLVLVLTVAIPCSWLAVERGQARRQSELAEAINKFGGGLWYDWFFDADGKVPLRSAQPPGPEWLRKLVGDDFLTEIRGIMFGRHVNHTNLERLKELPQLQFLFLDNTDFTDAGLEHLERLKQLKDLGLGNTRVTDAGLHYISGLTQLQVLRLDNTRVTDEGVKKLQQALPNCRIVH